MREKPAGTGTVAQASIKKEKPDDAQVQQEKSNHLDHHALWLQVKQEIKEEMQQDQIDCLGVGTAIARHAGQAEVKRRLKRKLT